MDGGQSRTLPDGGIHHPSISHPIAGDFAWMARTSGAAMLMARSVFRMALFPYRHPYMCAIAVSTRARVNLYHIVVPTVHSL